MAYDDEHPMSGETPHERSPCVFPNARACGARTRAGTPCQLPALPNGRCKLHGGKSLGGPASPTFKTGYFSRCLPRQLLKQFDQALADPELTSLQDELALLKARQAEILGRLKDNPIPEWSDAERLFSELLSAEDDQRRLQVMEQLGVVLAQGSSASVLYESTWTELRELIQERSKVSAKETRRHFDLNAVLTAEQAMMMVRAIINAIRDTVTDPKMLQDVFARIRELLPLPEHLKDRVEARKRAIEERAEEEP
jgi:hypothetical protein